MSNNWWADKLGTAQTPATRATSTPPTYQPPAPSPTYVPPQQDPYRQPREPQSSQAMSKCPGCSSGNYGSVDPSVRARCYDCGYPITQSGSGPGTGVQQPQGSGPVQASRQVSTANNFNPQGIIGRIE
jgi:ribosomal protein S27E